MIKIQKMIEAWFEKRTKPSVQYLTGRGKS
jgi:hypothetical protein